MSNAQQTEVPHAKGAVLDNVGKASLQELSAIEMRESITTWLLVLLCLIAAFTFMIVLAETDSGKMKLRLEALKPIIDVLIVPVFTLLSSVVGFYFGSKTAKSE